MWHHCVHKKLAWNLCFARDGYKIQNNNNINVNNPSLTNEQLHVANQSSVNKSSHSQVLLHNNIFIEMSELKTLSKIWAFGICEQTGIIEMDFCIYLTLIYNLFCGLAK